MGHLYRLLMLLPRVHECVNGSLYGLPLLLSPSPHSAIVPLSGLLTLLSGFHFVIGVLYGLPLLAALPPPPHCWLYTLWVLEPRGECPKCVKCDGDL
ncbi:unnamed protein product [Staurois parvus]|uniref:Uncharacterized protein n=1 Tax=Staurois parvus TaxID=386267 RepID=A0ABN9HLB0_9NEOB|nr:unnamed protein product [Staurois parvus]